MEWYGSFGANYPNSPSPGRDKFVGGRVEDPPD